MSVQVTLTFSTAAAAAEALNKLDGVSVETVTTSAGKRGAKTKETAAAETTAAATATAKPAAKAPSIDDIKKALNAKVGFSGEGKPNAQQSEAISKFVRSFGIVKMSDSTDAIRLQMAEKLAEMPDASEAAEDDPMA